MKTTHILIGLMVAGSMMMAGEVNGLTSFTPGTKAMASEVNGNFAAVKTAVDGNAGDISTNKGKITHNTNDIATNENDIRANETAIDNKVAEVKVDGGLNISRADGNVTLKLSDGYVVVHGVNFTVHDEKNCKAYRTYAGLSSGFYFRFNAAASVSACSAFASVSLPVGAQPIRLTCKYVHNDNDSHTFFRLHEQYSHTSPLEIKNIEIATINDGTVSSNLNVASVNATPATKDPLADGSSAYYIWYSPSHPDGADTNEKVYDCKVSYRY